MKVTMGRIVVYQEATNVEYPAIVSRVLPDGTVDLTAFPGTGLRSLRAVRQGDEPGTWNWPASSRLDETTGDASTTGEPPVPPPAPAPAGKKK
jgi:hypothetical protein